MSATNEQLKTLSRMAKSALGVKIALIVLLVALLIAGFIAGQPPYFMGAIFLAVVVLSVWESSPHIRNAAKAYRAGMKTNGTVTISITEWSDSQTYHAIVEDPNMEKWSFEFIPQGWRPNEGHFGAELYYTVDAPWPALVVVKEGILFPRYKPKQAGVYA